MSRIITLLTDFQDFYPGVMKGVILSILPEARIVDISHAVEPQNVFQAAFLLSAYHDFFRNAVHVVVVDPGVGGEREIILAKNESNFFLAPNNGALSAVIDRCEVYEVDVRKASRLVGKLSATFHGRDVFAPAAALIASGREELLKPFEGKIKRIQIYDVGIESEWVEFSIPYIDSFGNAVTNLREEIVLELKARGFDLGGIHFPLVEKYEDVGKGEPLSLIGSFGTLEFSVREGNAVKLLGLKTGRLRAKIIRD
jgi:hypothetical protein